jgi:hypothetical protein
LLLLLYGRGLKGVSTAKCTTVGVCVSVVISVRIPRRLREEMERLKQSIGVLEGNLAAEFVRESRGSR